MKILITGGTTLVSKYATEYFAGKVNDVSVINRGRIFRSDPAPVLYTDSGLKLDFLYGLISVILRCRS